MSLARLLGVAANNLDLVRRDGLTPIVHFEGYILDQKGPDFVAESVGVEASLELKSSFYVLLESLSDGLVKIAQNLHSKLRVDALVADEIIKGICQSEANAASTVQLIERLRSGSHDFGFEVRARKKAVVKLLFSALGG